MLFLQLINLFTILKITHVLAPEDYIYQYNYLKVSKSGNERLSNKVS